MVGRLSDRHILKRMPQQYVDDFPRAAVHVYDPAKIQTILQRRFYLPNDSTYKEDAYLQSASELSVANYIKARKVADFEIDKPVNPNNKKDVDIYYRIGSTKVSLEVKCPFEEEQAPLPVITTLIAGRVPNYDRTHQGIKSLLGAESSNKFVKGKNRDNRMKDALVSAHGKFRSDPELDDVLLIPIRNPLGRRNVFSETVDEGLSIFNHYRKEFLAGRVVTSGTEEIQDLLDAHTKVTRFVLIVILRCQRRPSEDCRCPSSPCLRPLRYRESDRNPR
jgi:hypothetical protein